MEQFSLLQKGARVLWPQRKLPRRTHACVTSLVKTKQLADPVPSTQDTVSLSHNQWFQHILPFPTNLHFLLSIRFSYSLGSVSGISLWSPRCTELNRVPATHVLLEPYIVTLFGNKVFADLVKMESYWIRVGPKSKDQCPYEKRHAKGRSLCGHKGRGWSDAPASQGIPRTADGGPSDAGSGTLIVDL